MSPMSGHKDQAPDGAAALQEEIDRAAALVRVSWRGGMENYLATRAGRAAVAQGEVARILAAGGR